MNSLDLMLPQRNALKGLREEIERLRSKLNSFVTEDGEFTSREQMLEVSVQLDRLIFEYMVTCSCSKVGCSRKKQRPRIEKPRGI
ncbi:MAG TPA: aspartyl-phosphate phosphatase Spo0E family protein [Firmicutes bacterium]|nr:aspartyl-phosphate phosphatase Spo0E family protein [Bacillota bacterium]